MTKDLSNRDILVQEKNEGLFKSIAWRVPKLYLFSIQSTYSGTATDSESNSGLYS